MKAASKSRAIAKFREQILNNSSGGGDGAYYSSSSSSGVDSAAVEAEFVEFVLHADNVPLNKLSAHARPRQLGRAAPESASRPCESLAHLFRPPSMVTASISSSSSAAVAAAAAAAASMAETEEEEASLAFQLLSDGWVGVVERGKVGSHLLDGLSGCGIELMHRVTAMRFELFDLLLSIFSKDGAGSRPRLRCAWLRWGSAHKPTADRICSFSRRRSSSMPSSHTSNHLRPSLQLEFSPTAATLMTRLRAQRAANELAYLRAARRCRLPERWRRRQQQRQLGDATVPDVATAVARRHFGGCFAVTRARLPPAAPTSNNGSFSSADRGGGRGTEERREKQKQKQKQKQEQKQNKTKAVADGHTYRLPPAFTPVLGCSPFLIESDALGSAFCRRSIPSSTRHNRPR